MSGRPATVVSLLTPCGRGAIAVVVVEGCQAVTAVERYFQAANSRPLSEQAVGRIVYGHWRCTDSATRRGEDLVILRRSNDHLEVHCHGGRQSSAQIVADLTVAGCTVIDAKQWLVYHHECPLTTSAHDALASATTFRTAAILLDQYHGALRRKIEAIDAELIAGRTAQACQRIEGVLQYAELGRHLTEPWRVVIAGEPNVGKSSLINVLVGYHRAIVFDKPGTTRDIVSSSTAIDGWPVELSDTAGLHETKPASDIDLNESAGITLARQRILAADLVVWVLDAEAISSLRGRSSGSLAQQQAEAVCLPLDRVQSLVVVNKIDLASFQDDQQPRSLCTSAVAGHGIEQLLAEIAARLVPRLPPPGAAVPFTPEQVDVLQAALDALGHRDIRTARAILRPWLAETLQ